MYVCKKWWIQAYNLLEWPPRSEHFLYNKRGAVMNGQCQCRVDAALIKSHFHNGHSHFFMDKSIELNRIYTNDMQRTCVPIEK